MFEILYIILVCIRKQDLDKKGEILLVISKHVQGQLQPPFHPYP